MRPGRSRRPGNSVPAARAASSTFRPVASAWTVRPCAQIEAAVCRYFRGDYIKQSLSVVGSKDASYFYVQLTLNL